MREYFVYILRCADESFYIGITNNYRLRLAQHEAGIHPESYTFSRRPLRLVYLEIFTEVLDAIAREKQIKRWSRKKKEALISGSHEFLPKLAESMYARRIRFLRVMVRRAHHTTALPQLRDGSTRVSP